MENDFVFNKKCSVELGFFLKEIKNNLSDCGSQIGKKEQT